MSLQAHDPAGHFRRKSVTPRGGGQKNFSLYATKANLIDCALSPRDLAQSPTARWLAEFATPRHYPN